MNNKIIPITHDIREYLKYKEKNDEKTLSIKSKFNEEKYDIIKEKGKIIITKKGEYTIDNRLIEEKLLFLKSIKEKLDKSLIWVYQEMVLSGYGYNIDPESDIYKVTELAYEDRNIILKNKTEKDLIWYENFCMLQGNLYEEMLLLKKVFNKEKKQTLKRK